MIWRVACERHDFHVQAADETVAKGLATQHKHWEHCTEVEVTTVEPEPAT